MQGRIPARSTLAANLRFLINRRGWSEADLAERARVAQKTVNNVLNQRGNLKVDTCEALGAPFGLEGWQMLMPNLIRDIEEGRSLRDLVSNYLTASDDGQKMILTLAEHEAKYILRNEDH